MPTKIEWTDRTWNPVTGCTKVSVGCENCYAEGWARRHRGRYGYPADDPFQVTLHPDRLSRPLQWKKPLKIFVDSMGDLFHKEVPDDFIDKVFVVMAMARHHTFQILTKRPERMRKYILDRQSLINGDLGVFLDSNLALKARTAAYNMGSPFYGNAPLMFIDNTAEYKADEHGIISLSPGWPPRNCWLGVTAENQATADERIPILLEIDPAVLFVSFEPLLGPINGSDLIYNAGRCSGGGDTGPVEYDVQPILDWVIVGGEAGQRARPMHPDWVRSIKDQCQAAGAPFFFKQWGSWAPVFYTDGSPGHRAVCLTPDRGEILLRDPWRINMRRVGKKAAGRILDGRTWDEFPEARG